MAFLSFFKMQLFVEIHHHHISAREWYVIFPETHVNSTLTILNNINYRIILTLYPCSCFDAIQERIRTMAAEMRSRRHPRRPDPPGHPIIASTCQRSFRDLVAARMNKGPVALDLLKYLIVIECYRTFDELEHHWPFSDLFDNFDLKFIRRKLRAGYENKVLRFSTLLILASRNYGTLATYSNHLYDSLVLSPRAASSEDVRYLDRWLPWFERDEVRMLDGGWRPRDACGYHLWCWKPFGVLVIWYTKQTCNTMSLTQSIFRNIQIISNLSISIQ